MIILTHSICGQSELMASQALGMFHCLVCDKDIQLWDTKLIYIETPVEIRKVLNDNAKKPNHTHIRLAQV